MNLEPISIRLNPDVKAAVQELAVADDCTQWNPFAAVRNVKTESDDLITGP